MARLILTVCGAVLTAAAASAQVVHVPGLTVKPFAGLAAGYPSLAGPKFGLIDMPGGPFGGFMYISELGGNEVSRIMPNGLEMPFTMLGGPTPGKCYGVDIDGPIANLMVPTQGLYGGPVTFAIGQDPAGAPLLLAPPPGGWIPWFPAPSMPGTAQVQIDRTPGFKYGGLLHYSDWGPDQTDGIMQILPNGAAVPLAPLPGLDPRYFTFDLSGGATGYNLQANLWVSSFNTGQVFAIDPLGVVSPPLAVLLQGVEGLAFGPGDPYFGPWLYVANLPQGTIDMVMPNGMIVPFASGFPGAAYMMFVTMGPYARYNAPTLYVADGMDSVWVIFHCPADYNNDGQVDFFDYLDFVQDYSNNNPNADYNGDGQIDFFDYLDFVQDYSIPC